MESMNKYDAHSSDGTKGGKDDKQKNLEQDFKHAASRGHLESDKDDLQIQTDFSEKLEEDLEEEKKLLLRYIGVSSLSSEIIEEIDTASKSESMAKRLLSMKSEVEKIRTSNQINERPVIRIFSQLYNETNDYIMASYVKFVESVGARVVPIIWKDSDEKILNLVPKLNGDLFPGGATALKNEDGSLTEHARKIELVLNKIKELNDQGIYQLFFNPYYPILSICMGFQGISQSEAPYKDTVELYKFDANDVANNITLRYSIVDSKLFNEMPQHLINALQHENITYNHHHDGIYPSIWDKYPALGGGYHLLGTSYGEKGVEYVAFIENKKYPIWGLQLHPEKNIFTWKTDMKVPHSQVAIEFNQFLANFFVKESKKNFNKFYSEEEIFNSMIEHFPVDLPQ